MLANRDLMPIQSRTEHGLKLCDFADDLGVGQGQIVSGFFPIRSEIDVRPLMSALEARGATLCLPAVIDKNTIQFRRLARDVPLVKTGFGTFGPDGSADVLDPDVLLLPLAAFDNQGNRVGYGAGYYDRAIARLYEMGKSPRLIGVAFEMQRVEQVPAEDHDVRLHTLLTENGLHHFTPGG